MTPQDIEAIVGGYHGDPFRILGPHAVQKRGGQPRWEVRAFLPQAQSVSVRIGEELFAMSKQDNQRIGFYCATLPGEPQPYRLQLCLHDGTTTEIDDPYRFPPLLSDFELHLHGEGTHFESYNTLGAHLVECEGVKGVRFAVWAPNALAVTLVGDFNDWDSRRHPMRSRNSGVWEIFLPGAGELVTYKYNIRSQFRGHQQQKADPHAFYCETPPKSASVDYDNEKYQ